MLPSLELPAAIHAELRALAERLMGGRSGHTLQPTALVHEAFLRLRELCVERRRRPDEVRPLFALAMRRVLIDHARRKRVRENAVRELGERAGDTDDSRVLAVDAALTELTRRRPRLAKLVELRFFGGFSVHETADILGVSVRTAVRDWDLAKAWLQRELEATHE